MSLLSVVVSFVLKIFTSETVPEYPFSVSMKSPALNGLKTSIMMPPAKFWTVPLSAMPMAIPPAASRAASDVVFTPSVPTVMTTSIMVSDMLVRLSTKEAMAFLSSFSRISS